MSFQVIINDFIAICLCISHDFIRKIGIKSRSIYINIAVSCGYFLSKIDIPVDGFFWFNISDDRFSSIGKRFMVFGKDIYYAETSPKTRSNAGRRAWAQLISQPRRMNKSMIFTVV